MDDHSTTLQYSFTTVATVCVLSDSIVFKLTSPLCYPFFSSFALISQILKHNIIVLLCSYLLICPVICIMQILKHLCYLFVFVHLSSTPASHGVQPSIPTMPPSHLPTPPPSPQLSSTLYRAVHSLKKTMSCFSNLTSHSHRVQLMLTV